MSTIYNASQIIGKDLYAKKKITVRKSPSDTAAVAYTVNNGNRVGTVYSYLTRDGAIWWMLTDNNYVKHEQNAFSIQALREQGAKTSEELEKEKEDKNKPAFEKFMEAAGKVLKYGAFAVGGFILLRDYLNKK